MSVRLILVPYHLGHRGVGMGAGPERLFAAGAHTLLADQGHDVSTRRIQDYDLPRHEVGATFELNRRLADTVKTAIHEGAFPLVLAGNCNSSLGSLSGIGNSAIGITWFDAHGDFNTPDSSPSGFFDGMCLNLAVGGCWQAAARSVPGFTPVACDRVVLVGPRDLDQVEQELLEGCDVSVVELGPVRDIGLSEAVVPALESVGQLARDVYVHVDLDVLSGDDFPVNEFSTPGGLSLAELLDTLSLIGQRFNVAVAGVTAYDPSCDPDGVVCRAALRVVEQLGEIGDGGTGKREQGKVVSV